MKRLQKAAVLAKLCEELRDRDSWCGETHIQKDIYVLEDMLEGDELGFQFILYKHGPYSFDLSEELAELRADRLFKAEPQRAPYRPRLSLTESGRRLLGTYPKTVALYSERIAFVADWLAPCGVAQLERIATALWVTRELQTEDVLARAMRVTELKPHVRTARAIEAVEEVDSKMTEAAPLL